MRTKLLIEQHFHGCFGIDFNKASIDEIKDGRPQWKLEFINDYKKKE